MFNKPSQAALLNTVEQLGEVVLPVRALAKVNLRLRVLGRFPNGYHDLSMVNGSISLADELVITIGQGSGFSLNVEPPLPGSPLGENLVAKAVIEFVREFALAAPDSSESSDNISTASILEQLPFTFHSTLTKRIPVGGGLGGGSSDAAGVLRVLVQLFGGALCRAAGLSQVEFAARVNSAALRCGADVPYALSGGFAWVGGVGDKVIPLHNKDMRFTHVALVSPPFASPTAAFYQAYRSAHPSIPVFEEGPNELAKEGEINHLQALIRNDFEDVLCGLYPKLGEYLSVMRRFFPGRASITGSGATLFAILSDGDHRLLPDFEREIASLDGEVGVYEWIE